MIELTYEEFCAVPMFYVQGLNLNDSALRMYRNEKLGIIKEVFTEREEPGNIYGGWKDEEVSYFLERDPREFHNVAELYVAYMERVCGVEQQ